MSQAKLERAKKEGRYLTPKQKEEQRRAELRKQALLASGVQIEGLAQAEKGKRPVYGNKKKKPGLKSKDDDDRSSTQALTPETRSPVVKTEDLPTSEPPSAAASPKVEVKDDWDAESGPQVEPKPEELATPEKTDGVKSDWDASSSDEESKPRPPKDAAKSTKPAAKSEPATQPKAKGIVVISSYTDVANEPM